MQTYFRSKITKIGSSPFLILKYVPPPGPSKSFILYTYMVALQKIDARSGDVYRLAKQMRRDNQDVMGEKPVKNDAGQLSLDEESKKKAWKEHYECLLKVEFPWNPEDLSEESQLRAQASQSPWR